MLHRYHFHLCGLLALWITLIGSAIQVSAQSSYTITDLGSLGGPAGTAHTVNNRGHVAGWAYDSSGFPRAFLVDGAQPRDLGTLGGSFSVAYALNSTGQAAGEASTSDYLHRAVLHDGSRWRDLGTLGGSYSAAYGIDNTGRVVGVSSIAGDGGFHAFLHDGARMRDLGTLGGPYSVAYGINALGQIVGWSYPATSYSPRAFLHDGTHMRDLGTIGGASSMATAINDAGQVVGGSFPTGSDAYHAFLYERGTMRDLGTLGGNYSFARAINAAGLAVGESLMPGNTVQHAFLFANGVIKDLNHLIPANSGWVLTQAMGINDTGQIVGVGTRSGETRSFLLTPGLPVIPVPAPPAGLTARAASLTQLDLSWTDKSDNETGFAVWRREGTNDWTRIAVTPANASRFSDITVKVGVSYTYRVCALSPAGSSAWSNTVTAATGWPRQAGYTCATRLPI